MGKYINSFDTTEELDEFLETAEKPVVLYDKESETLHFNDVIPESTDIMVGDWELIVQDYRNDDYRGKEYSVVIGFKNGVNNSIKAMPASVFASLDEIFANNPPTSAEVIIDGVSDDTYLTGAISSGPTVQDGYAYYSSTFQVNNEDAFQITTRYDVNTHEGEVYSAEELMGNENSLYEILVYWEPER